MRASVHRASLFVVKGVKGSSKKFSVIANCSRSKIHTLTFYIDLCISQQRTLLHNRLQILIKWELAVNFFLHSFCFGFPIFT